MTEEEVTEVRLLIGQLAPKVHAYLSSITNRPDPSRKGRIEHNRNENDSNDQYPTANI